MVINWSFILLSWPPLVIDPLFKKSWFSELQSWVDAKTISSYFIGPSSIGLPK